MKKTLTSLLALIALSFTATAAVDTGAAAPDFTLTDTTGAKHSLSDFKGKYVVLEWTNHQCPFVKKHYKNGDMQATQKALTADGVVWLQIVSSAEGKQGYVTAEQGEAVRKKNGHHSTAMLLDPTGKVGHQYSAKTSPHMFIINPEGAVIYQGAIDSKASTKSEHIAESTNYVKVAYASAKAGEPVANATTSPYGCSIKY